MALPLWAWIVAGALLGAIAGSFLATLTVRWPRGERVSGRSVCDGCGRTLRWFELIPLVSAVAQRGRCRRCGAAIDPDHAAVEWGCAVIGAAAFGLTPGMGGAGWALFGWVLLTLAALDARHMWLPDRLTLTLGVGGLLIGGLTTGVSLIDRTIGAFAGLGALWLIGTGYRQLRGREGLGGGDPKLLGAIGTWLGWQALPFILLVASILGLIAATLSGELKGDRRLAFGAALAAAALPGWLALRLLAG